jgi:ribosomal protein L37AE/L43A
MPFKPKANKKIEVNKNATVTLDSKHHEMIEKFNKELAEIPKFEREIAEIQYKINVGEYDNIEHKLDMIDTIKSLKTRINRIKKNKNKYLLNNSKYIFNYFENKKDICKNNNKKTILNKFFMINKKSDDESADTNTSTITSHATGSASDTSAKKRSSKNMETKRYLSKLDDDFLDINDYIEHNHTRCDRCTGELVSVEHEGIMICKQCSHQMRYLIEHEKPSYKEPPKEVSFYAYKRINHFREILAQFQAKETTQIDDDVLENIKRQVKKERIGLDQLTNEKTKQILKNLGYNKYYEHIPFIKEKLGIKPPTMSIELENTLCNLFLEIQKPYATFCPNERVNFLNYYYVLFKLCELLGEDEYLPHFYMLKDPIKRMEQDEIWKKICGELHWEFIPTP